MLVKYWCCCSYILLLVQRRWCLCRWKNCVLLEVKLVVVMVEKLLVVVVVWVKLPTVVVKRCCCIARHSQPSYVINTRGARTAHRQYATETRQFHSSKVRVSQRRNQTSEVLTFPPHPTFFPFLLASSQQLIMDSRRRIFSGKHS